jgi:hypothetical protein
VSAFRADEHAIIFIGVFRIAFWAVWELHIGILKKCKRAGKCQLNDGSVPKKAASIAQIHMVVGDIVS